MKMMGTGFTHNNTLHSSMPNMHRNTSLQPCVVFKHSGTLDLLGRGMLSKVMDIEHADTLAQLIVTAICRT
jgi:hypothetical protein